MTKRVVLVPTARPTFAVEAARRRVDAARALLEELGAEVVGPRELVMTSDDVERAAASVDPDADLVVNVCASFSDATPALRLYAELGRPVLLWSFREPGPVGDRLWLNSLCGANLFGHALVCAGAEVRWVHGDPGEPLVREALRRALDGELPTPPILPREHLRFRGERAELAEVRGLLDGLRGARIGAIGDAPTGFTPSEFDPGQLDALFGITVDRIDVDDAIERVRAVGAAEQDRELATASTAQPSLRRLDKAEVRRHAAVTSALRDWRAEGDYAAVAVRCWPEFPTRLGVCPCSSLSRLADAGTPTACERDVLGAVTMLLLETLGAGTTYLVDLVDLVDLEEPFDLVRLWHCGSAATSLAAEPSAATQSVHCNRRIGVAGDFPLRTGPVVLARLAEDPDAGNRSGLRLLLASGESLPEPNRFQGNTAAVRLDTRAEQLVAGLITGGFPHHTVLAWTDVRPRLRAAADLLSIPVVEW
ncbi:MAG: hypothetical protein GEV28_29425 [Actinophytocola sp.]|uniref:hypothetical protein n=1 Tax=Actinophytocola sp. TaxID=1872138 RepID=UPI001321F952|nr:hypothetical protein [Actinophytocola sp.]MPZ84299.1 hypothetical protein [Actinophytocola sp.]